MTSSSSNAAREFIGLFGSTFLLFHRRAPKRSRWTPQGWAVLQHLEMAGPLTVTEAAKHMNRAQSVMSEIVDGLERMRDQRDRRRTLVWLTDDARVAMETERQVLCAERLERAFAKLGDQAAENLLQALRALVDASDDVVTSENPGSVRKSEP
jgi:DNA-binding MarR family transcriptional regulator